MPRWTDAAQPEETGMTIETTAEHEARHALVIWKLFGAPPFSAEVHLAGGGLVVSEDAVWSPGDVPLWQELPALAVRLRERGLRCAATQLAPHRPSGGDLIRAYAIAEDLLESRDDRIAFIDEARQLAAETLEGQDAVVRRIAAELERRLHLSDDQLAVLLRG
jgi:hypothetical protein